MVVMQGEFRIALIVEQPFCLPPSGSVELFDTKNVDIKESQNLTCS